MVIICRYKYLAKGSWPVCLTNFATTDFMATRSIWFPEIAPLAMFILGYNVFISTCAATLPLESVISLIYALPLPMGRNERRKGSDISLRRLFSLKISLRRIAFFSVSEIWYPHNSKAFRRLPCQQNSFITRVSHEKDYSQSRTKIPLHPLLSPSLFSPSTRSWNCELNIVHPNDPSSAGLTSFHAYHTAPTTYHYPSIQFEDCMILKVCDPTSVFYKRSWTKTQCAKSFLYITEACSIFSTQSGH